MVTFDIVEGNPGALQFMMDAYDINMGKAEGGFQRMQANGITGCRLYMLWNDCCDRNTSIAVRVMREDSIESIVDHINYDGGRGKPYNLNEWLED